MNPTTKQDITPEIQRIVDFCNALINTHTSDAIFINDQTAINVVIAIREFALKNPDYQLKGSHE